MSLGDKGLRYILQHVENLYAPDNIYQPDIIDRLIANPQIMDQKINSMFYKRCQLSVDEIKIIEKFV